jgi:hypothetical protein
MAITCLCPQCQKTLAIGEEFASQPMRCPLCMALFQSPPLQGSPLAPPPLVNPTARDDAPPWLASASAGTTAAAAPSAGPKLGSDWGGMRNGAADRLGSGWHMVRRGLTLIPTSLLIVFVVLVLSRSYLVMADPEPKTREFVLLISIPSSILGTIAAVLGGAMCSLVPRESGLRVLALSALGCLVACLVVALLTLGIRALLVSGVKTELAPMAYLPAGLLAYAGGVLFLLFLRGVARFFRNGTVAQETLWCALGLGGSPVLYLLVIFLLYVTSTAIGGDGSGRSLLTSIVLYLFAGANLFWFLRVLRDVRRTVERAYLTALS